MPLMPFEPISDIDPNAQLPKLAIVTTEIGIPSEIWMLRQAHALRAFDRSLWGWSRHADASDQPLREVRIPGGFPTPKGILARGLRKIGHPAALRMTAAERAAVQGVLAKERPDIVLAHFGWNAILMAQVLPKDVPLVVHVHGRDASAMLEERSYRQALAQTLERADALVAVGQHQIKRLRPLGLPDRVALIPCGAPLDLFAAQELPTQPDIGDHQPIRFATLGRLSHEKGMIETLSAFETCLRKLGEGELVIIGFGPLQDTLQREIAQRGMGDHVRLTGRLSPPEIAQELAQAHVYLQHSQIYNGWTEGFGVTLTEAGAVGLPLLASASGGLIDQIEEGENGFLFPPGDVAAQAELMLKLARDAALRRSLGEGARRLAARFDAAHMSVQLEHLLQEVLAQH
ncbi:glycosyltransferase [Epibacterium sp. SM1979]|uniref:Glycosyltransferase n=1 Tax=Tritonibacter litoralis TaxID=2662264 RepID=A0A843YER9_9RHOB|nr:glycosyltransferase family 4 protein [Tritonibacter litoralis]MQQ09576.1 glycosyltransferase [Tritonibacter litoralis]